MMCNTRYVALFFALGLSLSSFVGCAGNSSTQTEATTSSSPSPSAQPSLPSEINQKSLDELKRAQKQFQSNLDIYLDALGNIAQTSSESRDEQFQDSTDYEAPKKPLDDIEKAADQLLAQALLSSSSQSTDPEIQQDFVQALKNVIDAVKQMRSQVIDPLSKEETDEKTSQQVKGIRNPKAVKQILTNLKQPKNNQGENSQETYETIRDFLNQQNGMLQLQIRVLERKIPALIASKVQDSTSDVSVNKLLGWIALITAIPVLGVVGLRLYNQRRRNRAHQLNKGRTQKDFSENNSHPQKPQPHSSSEFTHFQIAQIKGFIQSEINHQSIKVNSSSSSQGVQELITEVQELKSIVLKQSKDIEELHSTSRFLQEGNRQSIREVDRQPSDIGGDPILPHSSTPNPPLDITELLAREYYQYPSKFPPVATVSLTDESQRSQWVGKSGSPVLNSYNQGIYWVITNDHKTFYLVPKKGLRLNEGNLASLKILYEFENQPGASSSPKTTKAAVISQLPGGEGWQLEQPGRVVFE